MANKNKNAECRVPIWLPDWQDESVYPSIEQDITPMIQWAWEFLRRNSDYQNDFKYSKGLSWEYLEDVNHKEYQRLCEKYGIKKMIDPSESYSNDMEDGLGFETINTSTIKIVQHNDWLGYKHSQENPVDWNRERPGNIEPNNFMPAVIPFEPHQLTVKVDLRRPLQWLLKEVSYALKVKWGTYHWQEGKDTSYSTIDKYSIYLRILDARQRGCSHGQIAKSLYPSEPNPNRDKNPVSRKISMQEKKAKKLCSEGYKKIASLEKHDSELTIDRYLANLKNFDN